MSGRGRSLLTASRLTTVLLVAGIGVSCMTDSVVQLTSDDIVEVRVSPTSSTLGVGRTLRLRAFPLDGTGALIAGQQVAWSSRATGIATVDSAGVVTGVSKGDAEIVATIAGIEASSTITVALAPAIVLSADSVGFASVAGGADPPPDSVEITNGGELALVGLAIDSVVYEAGASDWLVPQLSASTAPAMLVLDAQTAGVTSAGTFTAVVWVSGVDAENSPAAVTATLTITAGAAASMEIDQGDGQTAAAGVSLPVAPSVSVTDAFGNPVQGEVVTFAVTGGGGSVTGSPATTDAAGIARVGSWTLGTTAGANELTATGVGLGPVTFTATGVPGTPAKIEVSGGDNQSAVAGSAVSTPPSAVVRDAFDNGVEGVTVTFEVESGGGSVTGATRTTDADGVAQVGSWTLGATAGTNTLLAVSAAVPDSARFTATGLSGDAVAVQYEAGDAQTDTVAATLAVPYAVKVVDANGNGVAGVPVTWEVTGGGGDIDTPTTTDANGVATSVRVLGTLVGTHTATAAVGGLGSPVPFSATATVGAPAVVVRVAGNGQSATVNTTVAIAPKVRVEDRFTNPIAGHSVTFSVTGGGGTVAPTTAITTAADGTATATSWRLGTGAGVNNNTVQALASGVGLTGNPSTFTATATADAANAIFVHANDNQTAITGVNVANPPTVRVEDQYGNVVSGVNVNFTASGTGSVGTATGTTNASGQTSTTWTVRTGGASMGTNGTFQNTLTATIQGTAISTSFSGFARYAFATHVNPMWASAGCTGCHFGTTPSSNLRLDQSAALNHAAIANVSPFCDSFTGGLVRRVATGGGVAAADVNSLLLMYTDAALNAIPAGANGACTGTFMRLSAAQNDTIRAWIRNGAPNN